MKLLAEYFSEIHNYLIMIAFWKKIREKNHQGINQFPLKNRF